MRLFCIFLVATMLHGEEIVWKEINQKLADTKRELKEKYQAVRELYENQADENEFTTILKESKAIRERLLQLQNRVREQSAQEQTDEEYATWDLGEVTIADFILEFGSFDYVYVIPPELGNLKIHLYSALTIPRQSWNEMVDLILQSHGIGVKQVNPYTKALYFLKQNPSLVEGICSKKEQLDAFNPESRIFYLFEKGGENARAIQSFFERFSDPKETLVYGIGRLIVLVGSQAEIGKLLDMHAAIWDHAKNSRNIRLIELKKLFVSDAQAVLHAFFPAKEKAILPHKASLDLEIMALPQGLVLVGDQEMIEKGEKILQSLESQLSSPEEKIIYWYTCRHSAPETLAETLERVYASLTEDPLRKEEKAGNHGEHFIVDNKTGSLCMVIKKDEKEKISSLLAKLDVPKKMVQIDVLLVEKKYQERGQVGVNLLQLGASSGKKEQSIHFDAHPNAFRKGILDFIFSRPKKHGYFPSFDITYSFLMAQENVKINANPSILAINQTPATISIVEEISINNGAVKLDSGSKAAVEKSFTRAQYGTTLVLTPTIHLPENSSEEKQGFITLQTNITFDTTQTSRDDRPPVTKRHIENEVRIADGETIILGGLKRTSSEESSEKIPFLGEIPGIGKLFSSTSHADTNTEMFIFITPHIIRDPVEDLHKLRMDELEKRPGDIPSVLERLHQAKAEEKKRVFEKSLQLLFEPSGYQANAKL